MKTRVFLLGLLAVLLTACSAKGPVRFYDGPPKPQNELAIIQVPAALTVLSIDGKEVDAPSKDSGYYNVQLEPGFHLIEFKYMLYWGSNDSGSLVKSNDVGVDAVFKAGDKYTLRYKKPKDADDAMDIMSDFNAQLVNLNTQEVHNSYVIKNLDAVLAARKANSKPAQPSEKTPVHGSGSMPNVADATQGDPVKHLKFWWLMADKTQRKAFMDWMKSATESFSPADTAGSQPNTTTPPPPADTINGVKIKP